VTATAAAISIIGIPLSLLIVSLPSVFLVLVALRLAIGTWRGFRNHQIAWGLACAVALIYMADFFVFRAWRVNDWLDGRAAALVAGDLDQLGSAEPIGTLAVLRNTIIPGDTANPCDDLCQRLLLTGAVKQVLALTSAPDKKPSDQGSRQWAPLDAAPDLPGMAWRLEQRDTCGDPGRVDRLRPVKLEEPPPARGQLSVALLHPEQVLRLKIAGGTCLVGEPMTLARADALLAYGSMQSGVPAIRAGYDAWADTLSAWRLAFWRRNAHGLVQQYRRTGVTWERLPSALVPALIPGSELRTENGWLRFTENRNRLRYEDDPPLGAFVTARLGLNLRLGAEGPRGQGPTADPPEKQLLEAQASALDRILAAGGAPSDLDANIVADYVASVGWVYRRTDGRADDAQRILRILQDRRLSLPTEMVQAISFALKQTPSIASAVAAALVERLEPPPPPMKNYSAREAWNRQIGLTAASLAQLPQDALLPYRAQAVAIMRDRERRVNATRLLAKLDAFGPDILGDILAMLDDAASLRNIPDRDLLDKKEQGPEVWQAGAYAICRLAPQVPGALTDLRNRVRAYASVRGPIPDETVAAAMLRMGSTEDDVRATLNVNSKDEGAMKSFSRTIYLARREDACR
jgi:hypothetical protein